MKKKTVQNFLTPMLKYTVVKKKVSDHLEGNSPGGYCSPLRNIFFFIIFSKNAKMLHRKSFPNG